MNTLGVMIRSNRKDSQMAADLSHDELVYLIQLVNMDFCAKQRKDGKDTPFEAEVFRKLFAEMEVKRESQ